MRRTSEVAIYIDVELAMKDGVRFFVSNNNVILTEGIRGKLMPVGRLSSWDSPSASVESCTGGCQGIFLSGIDRRLQDPCPALTVCLDIHVCAATYAK